MVPAGLGVMVSTSVESRASRPAIRAMQPWSARRRRDQVRLQARWWQAICLQGISLGMMIAAGNKASFICGDELAACCTSLSAATMAMTDAPSIRVRQQRAAGSMPAALHSTCESAWIFMAGYDAGRRVFAECTGDTVTTDRNEEEKDQ